MESLATGRDHQTNNGFLGLSCSISDGLRSHKSCHRLAIVGQQPTQYQWNWELFLLVFLQNIEGKYYGKLHIIFNYEKLQN